MNFTVVYSSTTYKALVTDKANPKIVADIINIRLPSVINSINVAMKNTKKKCSMLVNLLAVDLKQLF
ncbi:hypothetical protein CR203_12270 [Salipaludibacillus neizhouensis]|uniref:Uncharacterized protein n=1 Tax=Salipaludibacillus neizhouensis TaxID=885475 RepID=A0A3A9KHV7_9BACI|nr:hypothetical protein CR203_12270 [Salipaludibacillus neizhouensis]